MNKATAFGFWLTVIAALAASGCDDKDHQFTADSDTVALWHFSSSSAGVVADSSVSGSYPLTLASSLGSTVPAALIQSKRTGFGHCLSLNADKQQYAVTSTSMAAFSDVITVELWVKFSAPGSGEMPLFSDSDSRVQAGITSEGKVHFYFNGPGWYNDLVSIGSLTPGDWHYLAFTIDSECTGSIYIDGYPDSRNEPPNCSMFNTFPLFYVGGFNNAYFSGAIDEMRISNIARSDEDIYEYYTRASK